MHAPFEVVSKLDCYETYKGMRAIYEAEGPFPYYISTVRPQLQLSVHETQQRIP